MQSEALRVAAEAEFARQHYAAHADIDGIFHTFHMVMLAFAIKYNPAKLAHCIKAAAAISVGCLGMILFHRPSYQKLRPLVVLLCHVALITLRAICVYMMQSEQAVHWRTNKGSSDPSGDAAFPFLVSMCNTSGSLLRLFEVVGLQQPFWLNALLSPYILLLAAVSGMSGFRLAYSNALFYSTHEAHDAVAALLDGLLDALVPQPATQQGTCSSCPGVAVYMTVLSYTGIVLPLYVSYALEKAARRKYHQAAAAAAAMQVPGAHAPSSMQQQQQREGQSSAAAAAAAAAGARPDGAAQPALFTHQSVAVGAAAAAADPQQQQQQHSVAVTDEQRWKAALQSAEADAQLGSYLGACAVHGALLGVSLVLCWIGSNALALQVLPRLLSSQQLNRWCPNRPNVPFEIAAEVYAGNW